MHKDVIWDAPKQTNKSFYFTIFFLCYVFHIVEPVEFIVILIHFKTFLALCSKFPMQNLGLEVKAHIQGLLSEFSAVIQLSFTAYGSIFIVSVCVSLQCFLCGGGLERVMVGAGLSVWGGSREGGPSWGLECPLWCVLCRGGKERLEQACQRGRGVLHLPADMLSFSLPQLFDIHQVPKVRKRVSVWRRKRAFEVIVAVQFPWREIPGKSCMYLKVTGQMSRTRRCKPQISVLLKSFLKKFQHSFSTITSDEWLAFRILQQ